MKRIVVLLMCALMLTGTTIQVFGQESENTLHMMYTAHSGYQPGELEMLTDIFKELSGIEVDIDYVNYEEQYVKINELVATYDVISLDQIWMADIVSKGVLTPLDEYLSREIKDDITPSVLKAFRYKKQMWAFPFLTNYQLFFYNRTVLEKAGFDDPPSTLEDMLEQMIAIKEQGIVNYPWTDAWKQGENLISEYIWLTAAFGGSVFDDDGMPLFDQTPGVKALKFMVSLLEKQLANPRILTNNEIDAKDDFLNGQAAFTTNWTFLEGFLDSLEDADIAGKGEMGIIPISKSVSRKTASVSGFQGLAITAASKDKDAAWKWIAFLTSPLVQRAYLFEMPIWTSVQTSKDTIMRDPMMTIKQTQLENVYHRPKLPNYADISAILQSYIYSALEGNLEPSDALEKAKTEIESFLKIETEK